METPYFNYQEFKEDFLEVYEPAEDSFLLLDALQNDADLIKSLNPSICLEVGSGSGILITSLAKLLRFGYFLSTDINHQACRTTLKCARNNQAAGKVEAVNTDLSTCLSEKLQGKVDVMLFNPPYVPTEDSEITQSLLNRSWAGGKDGRVIIDRFLSTTISLLAKDGLLYLLLIKENRPDEVVDQLNASGFKAQVVLQRKAKNETQFIVRARRL